MGKCQFYDTCQVRIAQAGADADKKRQGLFNSLDKYNTDMMRYMCGEHGGTSKFNGECKIKIGLLKTIEK
ncbi:hypothetical protein J4217_01515 [Candidatus Pacearchaeota archaeon]|nr:hypothetical protein [Candidatus Pacearchaeota archaeon]